MHAPIPTYLQLSRHGIFYFRMAIPVELRTHFGAREVKRSLKTRQRQAAIKRAQALAIELEAQFNRLRENPVKYIEMKRLLQDAKEEMVALLNTRLDNKGPLTKQGRTEVIVEMKVLRTYVARNDYTPRAKAMADGVLAKAEISLPPDSDTYKQLCVESTKMLGTMWQDYLDHSAALDDYTSTPKTTPIPMLKTLPNTAQTAAQRPSVHVRELVEAFCSEKRREGSWTAKTEAENQAIFDLFIQIVGDVPVEAISAERARNYKTVLLKLPPNLNKNPLYRGKSIEQILAMNAARKMAVNTVNKNLTHVGSLFAWAKKHGYVDENYFDKLTLKKKKRPHEERSAFTRNELGQLFSTKQYRQHRFGHPYYYWLPLLGLYTGARLEELCQLHLDDVQEEDGIPVIDINDDGNKKLKSPASQRRVPIHPKLITLGLLDYVSWRRAKGEARLWPELNRGRDGYSQAASRWFSRYREPLGLHNQVPRKDFHSFRHTLTNELKQQGLPEDQVAALIGHSKNGITFARYGKPYSPAFLSEIIKTLDYDDALAAVRPFKT